MKNKSAVLLAACIGDSLGQQFETKNWNNPAILAWDGSYGVSDFHKLKPGFFTDDGWMLLALSTSLIEKKYFDPNNIAEKYLEWYLGPNFVGAGKATSQALDLLKHDVPWYESGILGALGNGTSMRSAPIGVCFRNDISKLIKAAKLDAMITHNSYEAEQASIAMAIGVALLLNGISKEQLLQEVIKHLGNSKVLDNLNVITSNKLIYDTILNKEYDKELDKKGGNRVISQLILGAKYTCIETVARAFYVFLATRSFQECVELAVHGGGDTDTAASMAGALAGAYYGIAGIDKYYLDGLNCKDLISELDEKLYEI